MKSETKLMLSTLIVAAVGALTMTPVLADGHHTERLNAQFVPSKLTRAEVRAEAIAALRAGTLIRSEHDAARAAESSFKSVRSRSEVAAEAREANRMGLLAPRWTEVDGSSLQTEGRVRIAAK